MEKLERNQKDEKVYLLSHLFDKSFEILKGRDDGVEYIVSLLNRID